MESVEAENKQNIFALLTNSNSLPSLFILRQVCASFVKDCNFAIVKVEKFYVFSQEIFNFFDALSRKICRMDTSYSLYSTVSLAAYGDAADGMDLANLQISSQKK
ncbi:hypothetical protein LOAG_03050 [Loa loa]|uniref:Uncharacterized protein n=1 Tax=Loa loa TaxID=7209 RepID=A0A1S0U5J0_LOALO|nr:hypothetical protein LOAG_03050 [Loa loa]EFO25437.1 hypothetical protein LOAG_03050 [Loa loa]